MQHKEITILKHNTHFSIFSTIQWPYNLTIVHYFSNRGIIIHHINHVNTQSIHSNQWWLRLSPSSGTEEYVWRRMQKALVFDTQYSYVFCSFECCFSIKQFNSFTSHRKHWAIKHTLCYVFIFYPVRCQNSSFTQQFSVSRVWLACLWCCRPSDWLRNFRVINSLWPELSAMGRAGDGVRERRNGMADPKCIVDGLARCTQLHNNNNSNIVSTNLELKRDTKHTQQPRARHNLKIMAEPEDSCTIQEQEYC